MPSNPPFARSSRITKKSSKLPSLRRSASSPFAGFNQRKPIQRSKTKPEYSQRNEDLFSESLDDIGIVNTLATADTSRGVVGIIEQANISMFDPLPEKGGFHSTRIAEILNFRRSLPKTVTLAHVHALSMSPTATEKEVVDLCKANVLRKIHIPGRGTGGSTIGEGLILFKDLEELLDRSESIDRQLKQKFLAQLRARISSSLHTSAFSQTELSSLKRAGFLTSTTQHFISSPPDTTFCLPSTSIPTISRAASGSLAAIGGSNAVVEAGGSLALRRSSSQSDTSDIQLSLPNAGPYLRLLESARSHLLSLLHKSPYRELPLDLLCERWDGGIAADGGNRVDLGKRARGDFVGFFPSRTRKWKTFWGLRFEWVLAEAMGSGLVECFETGSVGRGIRIVS
ncbi:MAG: hypothetical protein Q9174_000521 [Haloplaca sp. 1 TL-2023]